MDEDLKLGLQPEPLLFSFPARTLDGQAMGQVDKSSPVHMLLPGGQGQYIQFYLLPTPNHLFLLGFHWEKQGASGGKIGPGGLALLVRGCQSFVIWNTFAQPR